MADHSRDYFNNMNGSMPHWGGMKPGPPVAGSYYPYEWKAEEKKQSKQQSRGVGGISNLSTVDVKQIPQQNVWGGAGGATNAPDVGWSTIKWENSNTMVQKPSTINTAGLQFVSAPAQVSTLSIN